MPGLFDPLPLRSVTLRNRIGVSPMCQYSAIDGVPGDWHLVHLGSRAVGGAGLVIAEATAVEPRGRISPEDAGLWSDAQILSWERITAFITSQGAVPAIQLAHAGRKASTFAPWRGRGIAWADAGGWPEDVIGPSALQFSPQTPAPKEMSLADIATVQRAFRDAAVRALQAGFCLVELHAAHGYLLNSFLSPLSNQRTDDYGGRFENRIRMLLETVRGVREVWPAALPLAVRISATDWAEGGWTLQDSVDLAERLKREGVDLIDCSSGGSTPDATIPVGPCFQVPFAAAVKSQAAIRTAAVGLITTSEEASRIISEEQADLVLLARESLRDPYFARRAAAELGLQEQLVAPVQYSRAW